ncbi:MAG TPA: hypothetical protein PLN52_07095 [Opitutaceae bacterium]|nr:hypothetical protein [Opitutaceae bacterium]
MMSDPTRARNWSAAALGLSVAALLGARAMPDANVGRGWHLALMLTGMVSAPLSGIFMVICWSDGKKYRRLKAGVGVISRWTVDRARWESFREQSKGWDKREGVRPNLVNLDQPCGEAGLEIVVTGDSLLVGNHFISFEPNVSLRAYPGWMEFHFTIFKPKGPPTPITLRIPLAPAPGSDPQAAQIAEAFRAARAAGNAPFTMLSKSKFLLIFLGGFFGLTGLVIALAYLLKRGP